MQWTCDICGYIHDDEEAPLTCPVCGAPQDKFSEQYDDDNLGLNRVEENDDMDDFDRDLFADYEDE